MRARTFAPFAVAAPPLALLSEAPFALAAFTFAALCFAA